MATRTAILSPAPALFTANRRSIQTLAFIVPAPLTMQAKRILRTEAGVVRWAMFARSPKVDAT